MSQTKNRGKAKQFLFHTSKNLRNVIFEKNSYTVNKHFFIYVFLLLCFFNCKKSTQSKEIKDNSEGISYNLKYAEGFSVANYTDYKVITIHNPWPNSEESFKYIIGSSSKLKEINISEYDGVITNNIDKIVVTSTTHIPALEMLGVSDYLVGFPGTKYISSPTMRKKIEENNIRELGTNEGINTEVLLTLNPDVVVGFGVSGVSKSLELIQKAGTTVIFNGDWVEKHALAKAEWIKFFGILFNKENEAENIFNSIEKEYLNAKKIAKNTLNRPSVLSGALNKDIWYLPSSSSSEGQFLKDANVHYLWENEKGEGSLNLSFESVFSKAKNAEFWISPSYYTSYQQLEDANPLYTNFEAFKNKNIFSFANTKGETGGLLYFELGAARPDLVLKDIIKICHKDLLPNYTTTFFKPLQ